MGCISLQSFAYCRTDPNDPNAYQRCLDQQESLRLQKEQYEFEKKKAEQERIDRAMQNSENSLGHPRWK